MNAMILKKIQTILALLLVGSVSMLAEGDDPFPAVPHSKYQANMTLTAQAMLNGEILTSEAIVAVYHADQIRGKARPNAEKNILSITVDGDIDDEDIYFKVYTGGRIIEVDQGAQYTYYGKIGSYDAPYIINLTVVTTNTSAEGWATTCLPYNAAVPEGVTVYAVREYSDGAFQLAAAVTTGTSILPKDTPVLLKSEGQTSYEWLSRVADGDVAVGTNILQGTTEEKTVEAESVLTLGHSNDAQRYIGFWLFEGTVIPACRAYMSKDVIPSTSRGAVFNWKDETTGVGGSPLWTDGVDALSVQGFDLQGRPFSGKGLKIINGKKCIVR